MSSPPTWNAHHILQPTSSAAEPHPLHPSGLHVHSEWVPPRSFLVAALLTFRLENSPWWALLCLVGCWAASLVSSYYRPVAPCSHLPPGIAKCSLESKIAPCWEPQSHLKSPFTGTAQRGFFLLQTTGLKVVLDFPSSTLLKKRITGLRLFAKHSHRNQDWHTETDDPPD